MTKAVLIKNAGNLHPLSLLDRLTKDFVQEDYILAKDYKNLDVLFNRMATLSKASSGAIIPVFTIFAGGDCSFINILKETNVLLANANSSTPNDRTLDIIKRAILEDILGLKDELQQNLTFTDDIPAALKSVDEGQNQLVFIIN